MPTVMPTAGLPLMVTLPETVASSVLLSVLVCEFARCDKLATQRKAAETIKAREGSLITFRGRRRGHHTQVEQICLGFLVELRSTSREAAAVNSPAVRVWFLSEKNHPSTPHATY